MPAGILFALTLAVALVPQSAWGCVCGSFRKPFCEQPPVSAESKDTAVFLGTVVKVSDVAEPDRRLVRLRVDESYVGSAEQTLELFSSKGMCSPSFEMGDRYLVIAGRSGERWSTNICAGTTMAKYAKLEIEALRAWKRGQRSSPAISGSVLDGTRRPDRRPSDARMAAGIRIMLTGGGVQRETRTDADGLFNFSGLAPAPYRLQMAEPGWVAEHGWNPNSQHVDLTTTACAMPYFSIKQLQASVRGRLAGPPGVPLRGIVVMAVPLAAQPQGYDRRVSRTNENGEFTLGELEPGEYVIGLNIGGWPVTPRSPVVQSAPGPAPYPPNYYPGVAARESAQVFRLEREQMIALADWTVPPPLKERQFEGVVKWPDGSPVADARVFLGPPAPVIGFLQLGQPTGADGHFTIWGVEGVAYRMSAIVRHSSGKAVHWAKPPRPGTAQRRSC